MEAEILIAKEGKVFMNKEYGILFGNVIELDNKVLESGKIVKETASDYVEVDIPDNYELGMKNEVH
jgi:hypothetical protein